GRRPRGSPAGRSATRRCCHRPNTTATWTILALGPFLTRTGRWLVPPSAGRGPRNAAPNPAARRGTPRGDLLDQRFLRRVGARPLASWEPRTGSRRWRSPGNRTAPLPRHQVRGGAPP